jgi:hypothetical protein
MSGFMMGHYGPVIFGSFASQVSSFAVLIFPSEQE